MNVTYYFYKTLRVTLFMGLVLTLVTALVTATVEWYFIPQLPSIEHLKDVRLKVPLRIYARDRTLIAEFGEERRMPIAAHEIPPLLIKAVLAAEDARFYDHPGVDLKGLLRAAVNLIKTGEKQQGGSTITMQVARNFFLSSERSFVRKFYEILLAWKIEKEFTKEEILELYLNKIFFGHRAYGVAAAAQVYYGRDIQELTLAEWAMLAGLPKAPSVSNPLTNSARALERRNYILGRMRELNYISEADYQQAVETPNSAQQYKLEIEVEAPHVAEMVRAYMLSKYGEEAYTNGYRVITTIEPQLQSHAQRALRSALYEYDERHGYRGPIEQVNLPKELPQLETTAAKILAEYTNYGELVPSLVLQTQRRNIIAYNLQVGEFEIDWSDLAWARRYINDNRRGRSPRRASNIVKRGDIIMARPVMEQAPKKAKTEKTQATAQTDSDEQPVENTAPPKISHWRLAEVPQIEGALVALSPTNGAIRALVGGFDYYHSKFNRVIQAERQPGSNFKPFIYSAALARGFTAASMINDAPIAFRAGNKTWMPKNYSHKYYGLTSLRKALAYSRNVASVRLLNKIGVQFAIDHVVKFGFDRERIPKNLTIALGTGDVTPLELARGFAVFANGGYRVEPFFIHEIEDTSGKIIYSSNPLKVCRTCSPEILSTTEETEGLVISGMECAPTPRYAPQVISPHNAFVMTSILKDVIRIGTARRARKLNRSDIAGKTGTTNDQRDAWFSGYTPDLVATTWVGFDQPRSLGHGETGGRAALPMWIEFMDAALAGQPEKSLEEPSGLVRVRIDPKTGYRTEGGDGVLETFAEESVPKQRHYKRSRKKSRSTTSRRQSQRQRSKPSSQKKPSVIPKNLLY